MNWHYGYVWAAFLIGMMAYWFKRAYYGINPPNPIANGYVHWLQRSAVPLVVRALLDSAIFWLMFMPGYVDKILGAVGWSEYEWALTGVVHVPPLAFFLGYAIDSLVDMGVSKIPFINSFLPQMPGPLPPTV